MRPHPQVLRYLRTRRNATFVRALGDATLATAALLATLVVVTRLVGIELRLDATWAATAAVPMGWALWRRQRSALDLGRAMIQLDHRLGLGGLLLTELERDTGPWQSGVIERLPAADELPRPDSGGFAPKMLGAAALVVGVLVLPALPPSTATGNPLIEMDLEELAAETERLREHAVVSEAEAEELERRIEELREQLADGGDVEWSDVDALRADLAREQRDAVAALERAQAELAASPAGTTSAESLASLAQRLEDSGVLAGLDPALAQQLENAIAQAQGDPNGQLDAGELAALTEALRAATQQRAQQLGAAELLDPARLADLASLAQRPAEPHHSHGPG